MTPNKNNVKEAERITRTYGYKEPYGQKLLNAIAASLATERARVQEIALLAVPEKEIPIVIQRSEDNLSVAMRWKYESWNQARTALIEAFKQDGMSE